MFTVQTIFLGLDFGQKRMHYHTYINTITRVAEGNMNFGNRFHKTYKKKIVKIVLYYLLLLLNKGI